MDNMKIYNAGRKVPADAQKKITGGRLNGMSDINPMWRIMTLTGLFGPCGIGWKTEITAKWLEPGANGEVVAFVDLNLYVKTADGWSEAIPGTGGSMYIANEKSGARTSDEAYKMATTDALSVACKMLGIGADVYWQNGAKYWTEKPKAEEKPEPKAEEKPEEKPETKVEAKAEPKPEVPVDEELPEPKSATEKKAEAVEDAKLQAARNTISPDGRTLGEVCDANPEELKDIAKANKDNKDLSKACVVVYNAWANSRTA